MTKGGGGGGGGGGGWVLTICQIANLRVTVMKKGYWESPSVYKGLAVLDYKYRPLQYETCFMFI